ncbi:hypothetical protein B0H94_11821 [Salsuginibacillus halophilus]|uniref:Uncharacterized protein n=1 Tax=Salsuginibacillus halophilus TaxID=517424 RepID=A0A2P8H672_9BACI|nr:hypothetical protein [Salsuginibacillus halophilus]PSL41708.1 hypothetical protein B0H94_11821 [Salsuginibacillus halophilus]
MGYIDTAYYNDEYKGVDAGDDLERYIERASELIDEVTNYVLNNREFEEFASFIQKQVKKATAAQVEFYVVNGGPEQLDAGEDYSNFAIGSFQYSKGGAAENEQAARVSPKVFSLLAPTGMLYQGVINGG